LRRGRRKNLLFLKKKKQKDFLPVSRGGDFRGAGSAAGTAQRIEVFWFFFSKKNLFIHRPASS
jgi:hypothetical protein